MNQIGQSTDSLFLESSEPAAPKLWRSIAEAARESGRSRLSILFEFLRLSLGAGRLSPRDYFQSLRLYLQTDLSFADKQAFIGVKGMRRLWYTVNHTPQWHGLTEDKFLFSTLMRNIGFDTAKPIAFFKADNPQTCPEMVSSEAALLKVLAEPTNYPFFGKPTNRSNGLGSICIVAFDEANRAAIAASGQRISIDELAKSIADQYAEGYLIEELLDSHPDVVPIIGERLATLRIYTIRQDDQTKLFRSVWKLPGGDNTVDNWAGHGNMVADIDEESGKVRRVIIGKGPDQRELTHHPETGRPLVGLQVPDWPETKACVLNGARILREVPLLGWDIAPSKRGPLIVETNYNAGHMPTQIASRKGVLTPEFMAWVKASARERKRKVRSERFNRIGASLPGFLVRGD